LEKSKKLIKKYFAKIFQPCWHCHSCQAAGDGDDPTLGFPGVSGTTLFFFVSETAPK
jgi:hypothetical protein